MKKCRARLCIPGLERLFFVILPSWAFQSSCCISSLTSPLHRRFMNQVGLFWLSLCIRVEKQGVMVSLRQNKHDVVSNQCSRSGRAGVASGFERDLALMTMHFVQPTVRLDVCWVSPRLKHWFCSQVAKVLFWIFSNFELNFWGSRELPGFHSEEYWQRFNAMDPAVFITSLTSSWCKRVHIL